MRPRALLIVGMVLASVLAAGARAVPADVRVEPGLLDVATSVDVLARFDARIPALEHIGGLTVHYRFAGLPAVYATVTPAAVRALAARDDLAYLERDKPVAFDLDSATEASRARDVYDPTVDLSTEPLLDADGKVIDGDGVGVAVVDTGLDGFHPDFAVPGKVGGNRLVTPAGLIDAPYTVGAQGHGTHVAGIAVGTGGLSGRVYRGVAPGATLYAFGFGASTIVFPSMAFDWILQHGAEQDPPIRIVNNSWHCSDIANCSALNPDQLHVRLASQLVEAGVVVTWAAGNRGGDGYIPATSVEARNPGVISVGNYNDQDLGTRAGCIYGTSGSDGGSSRGSAMDPSTWPDVIAPGNAVMSTWAMTYDLTDGPTGQQPRLPAAGPYAGVGAYRVLTGTSMAAPHVAGIVALMLQARPNLSPTDMEYLLKATASKLSCGYPYPRADASHPFDGANYVEGHGLVDARAAVEQALSFDGIPSAPPVEPLPEEFLKVRVGIEPTHPLYLTDDGGLSSSAPADALAPPRVVPQDTPVSFTSAPFDEGVTIDGAELGLWLGSGGEHPFGSVNSGFRLQATLDRLAADGAPSRIAANEARMRGTLTAGPMHRVWVVTTPEPVTIAPGERVRLTLRLSTLGSNTLVPEVPLFVYADAEATPSRIALGTLRYPVPPDTFEGCQVRHDCTRIGGEVTLSSFACDEAAVGVSWFGPPGSVAWAQCWDAIAVCVVPGVLGDPWDSCEASSVSSPIESSYFATCGYRMPDGARGGAGRCFSVVPLLGGGDR